MIRRRMSVPRRDRGSLTPYLVAAATALTLLLAVVVDFNGQVNAEQAAQMAAAEAARAAGQAVEASSLVGGRVELDRVAARSAAEQYLARRGLPGDVTFFGTSIVVSVRASYPTQMLSMVGIRRLPVHAIARAQLVER